jgi:glycosyltransferase involved in cell wall biosynthesis
LKNLLAYRATEQSGILPQLQNFRSKLNKELIYHPVKNRPEIDVPKVSAVIITYNEEVIISETLSRLWWCDEIVIIDSGSTDKTVELCKSFGCSVFHHAIDGFGKQKIYGVSKAKNDWILCIDADELLSEPLIEEIQKELSKNEKSFAAFEIPLNLVFMNRVFRYGKENYSPKIRLFNKYRGNWDGAMVHETVIVKGPVKKLKNKIFHYSYTSYSQFLKKIDLYSGLSAKKLLAKKTKKSRFVIILGLPFNFFKYYVIDRNFLNGYQGFAWAALNALYHFVKYLKLEELNVKNGNEI